MEIYFADKENTTAEAILENGIALHRDLKLGIIDVKRNAPVIWSHTLYVPGRPEIVDYTDTINGGIPSFKSRDIKIVCDREDVGKWNMKASDIIQRFHGKKMHILFSDDPEHYFVGRIDLSADKINAVYNEYTFTITCNPYRYVLPSLSEYFTDFIPDDRISRQYDFYLGRYCGMIEADYEKSGYSVGYIDIFDDEGRMRQSQPLIDEKGTISFSPSVFGNIKFQFVGISKITMNGSNLEV